MISGHKTRSVFERYNIVSEDDLRVASKKHEEYLKNQMGTISGTVTEFDKKKDFQKNAESLVISGAGGETRTRKGIKPGGF